MQIAIICLVILISIKRVSFFPDNFTSPVLSGLGLYVLLCFAIIFLPAGLFRTRLKFAIWFVFMFSLIFISFWAENIFSSVAILTLGLGGLSNLLVMSCNNFKMPIIEDPQVMLALHFNELEDEYSIINSETRLSFLGDVICLDERIVSVGDCMMTVALWTLNVIVLFFL